MPNITVVTWRYRRFHALSDSISVPRPDRSSVKRPLNGNKRELFSLCMDMPPTKVHFEEGMNKNTTTGPSLGTNEKRIVFRGHPRMGPRGGTNENEQVRTRNATASVSMSMCSLETSLSSELGLVVVLLQEVLGLHGVHLFGVGATVGFLGAVVRLGLGRTVGHFGAGWLLASRRGLTLGGRTVALGVQVRHGSLERGLAGDGGRRTGYGTGDRVVPFHR